MKFKVGIKVMLKYDQHALIGMIDERINNEKYMLELKGRIPVTWQYKDGISYTSSSAEKPINLLILIPHSIYDELRDELEKA